MQYTYPQDPDTQTLRLQGVLHSTEGAPNFCYKVNAEQYFTDVTLSWKIKIKKVSRFNQRPRLQARELGAELLGRMGDRVGKVQKSTGVCFY